MALLQLIAELNALVLRKTADRIMRKPAPIVAIESVEATTGGGPSGAGAKSHLS